MSPTIVLITGANRGIGRGILKLYLAKPNHLVIAANRNLNHPTSKDLLTLPTAEGTSVKVVKLDQTSPTDAAEAAQTLKKEGIDHIDIYIANAAIAYVFPTLEEVKVEDMRAHFETNVVGFVRAYQELLPLLKASSNSPKLVTIGSSAAFLTVSLIMNMIPSPNAAYAPTKLVQHWYTKKIADTEPWLIAFPIDPGHVQFVQSDLGNNAANLLGLEKATTTVEDSTQGLVAVIDASTKETHSGRLWKWTGEEEPW